MSRGGNNKARWAYTYMTLLGAMLVFAALTGAHFTSGLSGLHRMGYSGSSYAFYAVGGLFGAALVAYGYLQLRRLDMVPEGSRLEGRRSTVRVRWSTVVLAIGVVATAAFAICHVAGLLEPLYKEVMPYLPRQVYVYENSTRAARARYQAYLNEIGMTMGAALFAVPLLAFIALRVRENMADAEAERQRQLDQALAERQRVRDLASDQAELTAEEFLSLADAPEFTGVYILHNETKGMYYVGQSVRVMQRVRQHLTGHGNGDVYADYKYGDRFTVRTISMASSGYLSIDDLERDMIEAYNAYDSGYNRQRGNGR